MNRALPSLLLPLLLAACTAPQDGQQTPQSQPPATQPSAAQTPAQQGAAVTWGEHTDAERAAWQTAASVAPTDAPDLQAVTFTYPAQTQTVAYAVLRGGQPAEVTLKSLSAELQDRFSGNPPPANFEYQERWLVGHAANSQCEPQQLRRLTLAGEVPPREGQGWTGALGLLPDPEPCSGVPAGEEVSEHLRPEALRLNEWNLIESSSAGGAALGVAVYPADAALPLPAGARGDELVQLQIPEGEPLSYEGLNLPAPPAATEQP